MAYESLLLKFNEILEGQIFQLSNQIIQLCTIFKYGYKKVLWQPYKLNLWFVIDNEQDESSNHHQFENQPNDEDNAPLSPGKVGEARWSAWTGRRRFSLDILPGFHLNLAVIFSLHCCFSTKKSWKSFIRAELSWRKNICVWTDGR